MSTEGAVDAFADVVYDEQQVLAATKIQAGIRRKLVQKKMAKFKARCSVLKELALTENKYLVSLRISTADYLHPLIEKCSTKEEILPAATIRQIFGNIEMVEMLSKKLLVEFTKRTIRITYLTRIGEVFLNLESSLQCYVDYVKNYDQARKVLGEAMEGGKGLLNSFDQGVQKKHKTRLGIRDFLIMPVQRIPRYLLLLRDILKQTDPALPDYEDVKTAMAKLEEFTVHMDVEAQRSEALRIIESKLSGDLRMLKTGDVAGRRFLHEGSLLDEGRGRKVYLFLFSDIVVVAKEQEHVNTPKKTLRRSVVVADDRMNVIETVPLTELSRCTNIKGDGANNSFKLDGTLYTAASDEERQIWINHIHRILRDLRSKATKKMTMLMSSSKQMSSPSTTRPSRNSRKGGLDDHRTNRWSTDDATMMRGFGAGATERVNKPTSSGFNLGTARLKRSSSIIPDDMVVTKNPLMHLQRHRSSTADGLSPGGKSVRIKDDGEVGRKKTVDPETKHRRSKSEIKIDSQISMIDPASLPPPPSSSSSSGAAGQPRRSKSAINSSSSVISKVDVATLPPPPVLPPQQQQPAARLPSMDQGEPAIVKFDFKGNSEKELTVTAGQSCTIIRTLQSGWSFVRTDQGQGVIPTTYVSRANP